MISRVNSPEKLPMTESAVEVCVAMDGIATIEIDVRGTKSLFRVGVSELQPAVNSRMKTPKLNNLSMCFLLED